MYTSEKRVERDGRLIAYEGEVMSDAEAEARGLLDKPDQPKPLDRMNKAELLAKAAEMELEVTDADTKAQILEAITEAEKPAE